jgi:hypothetical protein
MCHTLLIMQRLLPACLLLPCYQSCSSIDSHLPPFAVPLVIARWLQASSLDCLCSSRWTPSLRQQQTAGRVAWLAGCVRCSRASCKGEVLQQQTAALHCMAVNMYCGRIWYRCSRGRHHIGAAVGAWRVRYDLCWFVGILLCCATSRAVGGLAGNHGRYLPCLLAAKCCLHALLPPHVLLLVRSLQCYHGTMIKWRLTACTVLLLPRLAGACLRTRTPAALMAAAGCPSPRCCHGQPTSCMAPSPLGRHSSKHCSRHATCHGKRKLPAMLIQLVCCCVDVQT